MWREAPAETGHSGTEKEDSQTNHPEQLVDTLRSMRNRYIFKKRNKYSSQVYFVHLLIYIVNKN